uniref:Uncharacterized protein n=1 Tax=viral metagenome TaxID=1070528 RepID=A0A6C0I372_9ZZZZ
MSFVQQPNPVLDAGAKLALGPDDWSSISIPVVPDFLYLGSAPFGGLDDLVTLRLMITILFYHHLGVGKVERVDFVTTPANVETGLQYPRLSVYVHFAYWADNDAARALRAAIESPEPFRVYGVHSGPNLSFQRKLKSGSFMQAFLAMNVNKQPIEQYTGPLNIHQLWAKVLYYEKKEAEAAAVVVQGTVEDAAVPKVVAEEEEEKKEEKDDTSGCKGGASKCNMV